MSNIANPASMASRIMLCTLNTSAWRATRLHKAETKAEQARHNSKAPKVLVKICDHNALTEIAKLDAAAATWHRLNTMPSVQDGMRMVPAAGQFKHSDKMHEFDDQRAALVKAFIADYENEKAAAKIRLNGLYEESMWPSREDVARRFSFTTRYLACPTDGAWGEWLAESARVAEEDLRDRVREALERVRDRCKADGPLYSTVFSNLGDLIAMVPDLNLTDAPDLQQVAVAAKAIAVADVEALRDEKNDKLRKQVGKQAASILTMLGGVK